MDTDQCPKCDAKTVVVGQLSSGLAVGGKSFEPKGMRFFVFARAGGLLY